MAFGVFKNESVDDGLEGTALTEDSLRLALAKLGAKGEEKPRNVSAAGQGSGASAKMKPSSSPMRRKFAKEGSVLVEKRSSSRLTTPAASVQVSKLRPKNQEAESQESSLSQALGDFKQRLEILHQGQKKYGERQENLEKRLAEMEKLMRQQSDLLEQYKSHLSLWQPPKKQTAQAGSSKKAKSKKFSSATAEENSLDNPIPIKLAEDAPPVEWWKN